MTLLRGYGEDRLVSELVRGLGQGAEVRVGPGDDCAVIGGARAARWRLLKMDVVVEGIHFRREDDPRSVGWKALCRALSDIAAMGGVPSHALVTLAVSADEQVARVKALYAGLRRAARRFGVSIVGGETSRSPGPLFLDVALDGWVERKRCVLRSGGHPDDVLYVTGRLGGSLAGKHLDFVPRLEEARWLVTHFLPTAMMDLSDGLAADLPRLAAASRCGFTLDESCIPRAPGATLAQALADGEDFELLFALAPRRCTALEAAWRKKFPRLALTRIGALDPRARAGKAKRPSTRTKSKSPGGYDHFAQR